MTHALRITFLSLLFLLPGCGLMKDTTEPLHKQQSTESAPVTAARTAIDEANALLTSINRVITQNVNDKIWTAAQAQGYLNESKASGKKVDDARNLLRLGFVNEAKTEAEAIKVVLIALQRRIATEARKEK